MKGNPALLVTVVTLTGAVLVGGSFPGYKELFQYAMQDCDKEPDITEDDVEIVLEARPLETRAQECLQYCVYQKVGIQSGTKFNRGNCVAIQTLLFMINGKPVEQATIEEGIDVVIKAGECASVTDPCVIAAATQKAYLGLMVPTEE